MASQHTIRSTGLSWREVDGEVVILDLDESKYLSLNGTGALLWVALAEGADDERLASLLVDRFGIEEQTAARDVEAFLQRCVDLGIVR